MHAIALGVEEVRTLAKTYCHSIYRFSNNNIVTEGLDFLLSFHSVMTWIISAGLNITRIHGHASPCSGNLQSTPIVSSQDLTHSTSSFCWQNLDSDQKLGIIWQQPSSMAMKIKGLLTSEAYVNALVCSSTMLDSEQ